MAVNKKRNQVVQLSAELERAIPRRELEHAVVPQMYPPHQLQSLCPVGERDRDLEIIRLLKEILGKLERR